MWCAATPGVQEELVVMESDRFFRPPYVGGRGWVGVRLDGVVDWEEIALVCNEAFRTVAPKKLLASADAIALSNRTCSSNSNVGPAATNADS